MHFLKKKTETPAEAPQPEVKVEAPKVEGCQAPVDGKPCGKPLAPGQSAVCQEHVRSA